jgi:hypothetical protein
MNWRKLVFPKCCVDHLTARKWLPCWRGAWAPPRHTDVTRFPIAERFCTALIDAFGVDFARFLARQSSCGGLWRAAQFSSCRPRFGQELKRRRRRRAQVGDFDIGIRTADGDSPPARPLTPRARRQQRNFPKSASTLAEFVACARASPPIVGSIRNVSQCAARATSTECRTWTLKLWTLKLLVRSNNNCDCAESRTGRAWRRYPALQM